MNQLPNDELELTRGLEFVSIETDSSGYVYLTIGRYGDSYDFEQRQFELNEAQVLALRDALNVILGDVK